MSGTLLVIIALLVLCVPVVGAESQIDSLIYTDDAGDRVLLTFNKVTKQYEEIQYNPDPEPDHFDNTPSTAGWCFRIGTGEDAIYWCNEVAWSKLDADDSQWAGITDPNIMLTLDPELEHGEFISTDDQVYYAHLASELTPIRWKGVGSPEACGDLGWTSDETSSAVTFNPDSAPNGRNYALTYTITASVGKERETVVIAQDNISKLRQQYVDLSRRRWDNGSTPTIPARTDFNDNFSTANYNHSHYGKKGTNDRYKYVVMHIGAIAEKIRKNEHDSTKTYPRVTGGFRYPKDADGNSLHQFGYALDMNPAWSNNNSNERIAMERRVRSLLGKKDYDTIRHGSVEHIHIEKQSTGGQGGDPNK